MTKTVVGLFETKAEAQTVKDDLVSEGYSTESIELVDHQLSPTSATESTPGSHATGIMDSIKRFFGSFDAKDSDRTYYSEGLSRGGALLAITVPENYVAAVQAKLEEYGASTVDENSSATDVSDTARAYHPAADVTGAVAIPVVEEELLVGKRQVNRGGVRVYSRMVETPVEENVRLHEEHVLVERNSVNRPASETDFETFKNGTIELTETAEEAVVSKQARVVEEVTISKQVSEHTKTVSDTLRHTEVEVEELPADQTRTAGVRR